MYIESFPSYKCHCRNDGRTASATDRGEILTAYPPAAPYTLTDVYGNEYEYINQSADEAAETNIEDDDD
jgi:hypothetical protein